MANQTEIAQELSRIESAKGVLLDKALELELEYYDPDEGVASKRRVNDKDALNILADAFDQMPHYPSPNPGEPEGNGTVNDGAPNTDGILIYGQKVHINDGYYTGNQVASVRSGSVGKPVISVDPSNGKITATAAMTEGYIPDGTAKSDESVVQHPNLTSANIKDGTTIFGIEGTFTKDGTATAGVILEGNRAYVKGSPVDGTMTNIGSMGLISFNPLEENIHTCISSPGGYVQSLSVKVTNHLLNRLKAI